MQPKDYFKKTFVSVFIFYIVFKIVGLLMNPADFSLIFFVKTIVVGLVTALLLGGLNYFVKFDFLAPKNKPSNKN
ncbi:hypothetical protein [Flavobacterium sp. XGLA_31]|uniref:hypothetical protein n=1 Tax=Flavobacterium sp. XGLA_31 TaxID=3447666 RepID=UPI003F40F8CC